ncbi:MAG TPA: GAF domain-containing protein, partial [Patescibacteria group bacterium]|nr:GAF domain-containing protein [Patescibacteria group bacterium]
LLKHMHNTFGINIIPENEKQRLQALQRYNVLDTSAEEQFNKIALLVAKIFNMPIVLISFVDSERVFFKANIGMGNTKETSRGVSLCALAVLDENVTVFDNPQSEPCLMANPLVTGEFGLQFYAGAPIQTRDGFNIGTLCLVDKKKRYINKDQQKILKDFAAIVMDMLEYRAALLEYRSFPVGTAENKHETK